MDPENGLELLMARYQKGDPAAASALIGRLSPQLRGFFLGQVASRQFADDLLQETWLRIHQVRHTYRPGQPLLPWLYAIARNVRVDLYRKTKRTETVEKVLDRDSAPLSRTPSADTPGVEALLAVLPESQREVIAMLKIAGMTLEEVALATSSSIGSVKQKAHRAYQKLREHFGHKAERATGRSL